MTTKEISKKISPILKQHGVVRAGIFGSVARGEAEEKSDIDILVEFKGNKTLLDLVSLKIDLEDKLNQRVDIQTYRGLHPRIKERVLREQVAIL